MTQSTSPVARRGDIQGLRAIAVLLVVGYHANIGPPGGFIGVDVFFVISGYVITLGLLSEIETSGSIDLGRFFRRRVRRLLPALAVLLSVVLSIGFLLTPVGGLSMTSRTGLGAALFNANTYLMRLDPGYFDSDTDLNALLHTWSLSVEEQFYLLFPVTVLIAWRYGSKRLTGRRRIGLVLGVVSVGSLGLSLGWSYLSSMPTRGIASAESLAFYFAPARAWEFLAGAMLVLIGPTTARFGPKTHAMLASLGVLSVMLAAGLFNETTTFPGLAALAPVGGTGLLLVAGGSSSGTPISRALAWHPLQRIGDLSYSWYLWHWPFIVFASALAFDVPLGAPIAALLSIIPAAASYRFVEQPFRRGSTIGWARVGKIASVGIAIPIVLVMMSEGARSQMDRTAFERHADVLNGCDNPTPIGERTKDCTWEADGAVGHALLIGDSQAGHLSEGFIAAMHENQLDATIATRSACPFVDATLQWSGQSDMVCADFVAESTRDIIEMRPELVVVASASDVYIEGHETSVVAADGFVAETPAEKQRVWSEGLHRTVARLDAADIQVIVVHPTPKFDDWEPDDCAVIHWITSDSPCVGSGSTTALRTYRRRALAAENAGVMATNAAILDLFDTICPDEECATKTGDQWMFRDGGHISVDLSTELANQLRSALAFGDAVAWRPARRSSLAPTDLHKPPRRECACGARTRRLPRISTGSVEKYGDLDRKCREAWTVEVFRVFADLDRKCRGY